MARTPFAHRPSRKAASLAVSALAALVLLAAAAPAAAAPSIGTPGPNWDGGPSAPTSDKPQSKLWYTTDAQGKVTWWATMWNTSGGGKFLIYRFDTGSSTWAPTGTAVDPRSLSIQDTLWDGSHLYVASAVSQRPTQDPSSSSVDLATRIMRFSFNPATKAWTKDWESRVETKHDVQATDPHGVAKNCAGSTGINLQCVGGTESVTLAKDTSGRVWVTDTRDTAVTATCQLDANKQPIPDPGLPGQCLQATSGGRPQWTSTGRSVYVYHSTSGDGPAFTTPYVLPVGTQASNINPDDISAAVSFDGKVGVFWGNQNTQVFYFATHDVANPNDQQWSLQTAFGTPGGSWSDDHFNLKTLSTDPAGQVFAVVKTSRNDLGSSHNGDPVTVFLRRDAAGNWSSTPVNGVNRQGTTDYSPTRAILGLDPTNRTAYVFSSAPCCSGGTIFEKLSNFDNPSFDSAATHLGGQFMVDGSVSSGGLNNPTTSKQPAPAGDFLYVLAGQVQTHFYWWNRIAIAKPTPPIQPGGCPGDPRCPKPPPTIVCPGNPNCPKPPPATPVEPPKPTVLRSRLGAVSASLSYFRNADSALLDGQLQIARAGRVLLAGPLALRCRACRGKIDAGGGHAPSLRVLRLQRGGDPQVLLTFQTRGTEISLIYRIRRGRLVVTGVNWGAPGFTLRDLNRDRIPELLTRDTRFARITNGGADAFLPLRILSFRDGRLRVVTRRFPRSLSSDATKLGRSYRSLRTRRGRDMRGVLAAYTADVTAFGKAARAKPLLADALRRGKLQGRGRTPSGRRFVAWLPRFVRATGYGR